MHVILPADRFGKARWATPVSRDRAGGRMARSFAFCILSGWILTCTAGAQQPRVEGDPALYELVRDSLTTNASHFSSGRMNVTVEIEAEGNAGRVEADVEWRGEDFLCHYRIHDPKGFIDRVKQPEIELARTPKRHLMVSGRTLYCYNNNSNMIYASDHGKSDLPWLELSPSLTWFRFPPYRGRQGRPWVEMVGKNPAFPGRNVASYAISREGNDLVKQVRRNHDGLVTEATFSFAAGGNVVKYKSTNPKNGSLSWDATYHWRPAGREIFALQDLEYKGFQQGKLIPDMRYHLKINSVDSTTPIDTSRFSLAAFLESLPAGVVVVDLVAGTQKVMNLGKPRRAEDLSKQADILRSRGFARP